VWSRRSLGWRAEEQSAEEGEESVAEEEQSAATKEEEEESAEEWVKAVQAGAGRWRARKTRSGAADCSL